MRLAVTALAAALALLSVAACSSSGGGSSPGGGSPPASTLAVGEFNPFTGPDAAFGPEMVGGCIPVIRLINAGGGVLKHRNEEQAAAIIRDHVLGSIKYLPRR